MKKFKWLIPTLGITSIVSAIPCVTTSCSKDKDEYASYETFTYTFDENKRTQDFQPEKRLGEKKITLDQLTPLFLHEFNNDKHMFADEITYGVIQQNYLDENVNYTGTITVSVGEINEKTSRCSFYVIEDIQWELEGYKFENDIKVEFKNMIFYSFYDESMVSGVPFGFFSLPYYLFDVLGYTNIPKMITLLQSDTLWSHEITDGELMDDPFTVGFSSESEYRQLQNYLQQPQLCSSGNVLTNVQYFSNLTIEE